MIKGKGYEITEKNFLAHEMIGLEIKVIKSTDPKREGIKGIVKDETQKTFRIFDGRKMVIVPKEECEFEFGSGINQKVKGKEIMKRSEDRLKYYKN